MRLFFFYMLRDLCLLEGFLCLVEGIFLTQLSYSCASLVCIRLEIAKGHTDDLTNLDEVLSVESLIRADDAFFAATGISGGTFLGGVSYTGTGAVTHSLMIRAKTGTFRYLEAHHNLERLMKFSSVRYD